MRARAGWTAAAVVAVLVAAIGAEAGDPPRRIVSLAPSVTETLFALGAGERVVGVSDFCDWPPAARKIERVGSYLKPNVEAVVARRPDLVIAVPSPGNERSVKAIQGLGIPVVVAAEGPRMADVYESVAKIAEATGFRKAGERLAQTMRARLEAVRSRLAGAPPKPTIFVVDHSPLVVVGSPTLLDELVGIAGGKNVARGLGPWPRLSLEYVVRMAPEVILDGAMGERSDLTFYQGLGLEAVEQGRVHAVRIDAIMRPGPRLPDGVESLARAIHPEAFE